MTTQFDSPWVLGFLLLLPLLAIWPRWLGRAAGLRYADIRMTRWGRRSARLILRPFSPYLRLLSLALIIVALARPQRGEEFKFVRSQGIDIALALDISGSMASLDFQPDNRLEAAKAVIGDFIQQRAHDRIGLVLFSSLAFHQSPPTTDHEVLLRLLDEVVLSTELGIEESTAIGLGLANAAAMLMDSEAKSKVVILLTDGVNNAGEIDPLTAAEAAGSLGIRVYTIAAARSGMVPLPAPVFGPSGERIDFLESEIDEEVLQQIAEITGGRFYRASDTESLKQIYTEIGELETSEVQVRIYRQTEELFGWALAPALTLLSLEMILRRTILRAVP